MRPELIIFDCDGVLVDTEPLVERLISENLGRHGLPIEPREVRALFTGGTMESVEATARARGARLSENWQKEIYADMFKSIEQGVDTIPGIIELIDLVEDMNIAKAVASNAPMDKMRRSLGPSGLWGRFHPNIYSREDHAAKPKPDMLLHAMKLAGTTADTTIFIDDSAAGCSAGIAAGVRTFGYAAEGQDEILAAVGAKVINSMDAVAEFIKST